MRRLTRFAISILAISCGFVLLPKPASASIKVPATKQRFELNGKQLDVDYYLTSAGSIRVEKIHGREFLVGKFFQKITLQNAQPNTRYTIVARINSDEKKVTLKTGDAGGATKYTAYRLPMSPSGWARVRGVSVHKLAKDGSAKKIANLHSVKATYKAQANIALIDEVPDETFEKSGTVTLTGKSPWSFVPTVNLHSLPANAHIEMRIWSQSTSKVIKTYQFNSNENGEVNKALSEFIFAPRTDKGLFAYGSKVSNVSLVQVKSAKNSTIVGTGSFSAIYP